MITVNKVLADWNMLEEDAAALAILPCCGSARWARQLAQSRPIADETDLFNRSDAIWLGLPVADWEEAFRSHPRIGENKVAGMATQQSAEWSQQEQSHVDSSAADIRARLEHGNRLYEVRFGRIFLVCATGKSAADMLAVLERRLLSDAQAELHQAVEEQRQITRIRLRKWLNA